MRRWFVILFFVVPLFGFQREPEVVVHNRILTTIEGDTISVMDVMKRMDFFLSQHYPQHLDSPAARFQFYTMHWRQTVQQMIDHRLMVADAESRKVPTTDAEIREEIHNRWGPNVMEALAKLGLSYEEAKALVHQEIVVQKMQWLRVTSKVMSRMTSEVLRSAYQTHLEKNPPKNIWTYQFLTLRCETPEEGMRRAEEIRALGAKTEFQLAVACDLLKQTFSDEDKTLLSLSAELQAEDKELSDAHRDILTTLAPSEWSAPILQQSRDGTQVVRIFHLKFHTQQTAPPFERLAHELKNNLLNQNADAEMDVYLTRLYQRFNYDPKQLDIPVHFEPFSLE